MPSPEAVEVARNSWGVILHYPDWHTLELKWLPTTKEMTEQGFKDTLTLHSGEGERYKPSFMLIDTTQFDHAPQRDTLAWRDEHIVPRYNAAGVKKFAFIVNPGWPQTVESGAEPRIDGQASFPTGWFESRENAYQWLAE
jgi:hypothetical protein